jgi:hypothetical protein
MADMDFRELPVVTGAMLSDYVVLSLFKGESARISVGLFRNVVTGGLKPSIGEDGYWYVGDVSTEVLAEGKTPEFRKAKDAIEFKYTTEDDSMWRPFIPYDKLRLRYEDLTPDQFDSFRLRFEDLSEENIKELQKPAEDAMKKLEESLDNQVLGIDMTEFGEVVLTVGAQNTEFSDGYISEEGEVTLEFNYE